MRHSLLTELLTTQRQATGPVVTDGAWGTQLQARGLAIGACPDAWNLTRPEAVEAVASSYVEAGSRVILTNTFGANRFALARHDLAEQAAAINQRGAAISRRAAGAHAAVFGCIGPTGERLPQDMAAKIGEAFAEQARALAVGGVDALVIETMIDLTEAKLALAAAQETGLPVVVCMLYGVGAEPDRTLTGVTLEQATAELAAAGADAIGTNCGAGAAQMVPICARLRTATTLPLWIKPNAGLPIIVDGQAVYAMTPEEFAVQARQLVRAGADFIGGCCGTGPEFIRRIRQ
jgi:5-methyltetrahydrofolate--homocysteine methyltransferase